MIVLLCKLHFHHAQLLEDLAIKYKKLYCRQYRQKQHFNKSSRGFSLKNELMFVQCDWLSSVRIWIFDTNPLQLCLIYIAEMRIVTVFIYMCTCSGVECVLPGEIGDASSAPEMCLTGQLCRISGCVLMFSCSHVLMATCSLLLISSGHVVFWGFCPWSSPLDPMVL